MISNARNKREDFHTNNFCEAKIVVFIKQIKNINQNQEFLQEFLNNSRPLIRIK